MEPRQPWMPPPELRPPPAHGWRGGAGHGPMPSREGEGGGPHRPGRGEGGGPRRPWMPWTRVGQGGSGSTPPATAGGRDLERGGAGEGCREDARQGCPPLGPAGEGPCRGPLLPEPRRYLAGVHWIFATIPAICDDLHQALVVAKGAATNTAAGSADRRRVSVGAQAGARWRGRQGCEVQEE